MMDKNLVKRLRDRADELTDENYHTEASAVMKLVAAYESDRLKTVEDVLGFIADLSWN